MQQVVAARRNKGPESMLYIPDDYRSERGKKSDDGQDVTSEEQKVKNQEQKQIGVLCITNMTS